MRYQGGKYMIARRLTEAILNDTNQRGDYYEPFIGGGSMAAHMGHHFDRAHYSDLHGPLILMWQAAHAGFIMHGDPAHFFPTDITRADYDYHKAHQPHSPATALIGFGSAFGGKYYGSYVGNRLENKSTNTFSQNALTAVVRKSKSMLARQVTTFTHCPYEQVSPAPGAVIYCDPPYQGTTGYQTGSFDHDAFWEWCRTQARRGCKVYISEYQAPNDFTCIYEVKKRVTLNKDDNTRTAVERLFTYNPH